MLIIAHVGDFLVADLNDGKSVSERDDLFVVLEQAVRIFHYLLRKSLQSSHFVLGFGLAQAPKLTLVSERSCACAFLVYALHDLLFRDGFQ